MSRNASYWIRRLNLTPHPEGGSYRQTYRADLMLPKEALPEGFGGLRAASTGIYYLLNENQFSAFHRLRSDEMWHFYTGSPLCVYVIDPEGRLSELRLGSDPESGEEFQFVVKAGCWFAARLAPPKDAPREANTAFHEAEPTNEGPVLVDSSRFALAGCTVAPGFHFDDFEMAHRQELVRAFPQHRELIFQLTRVVLW